ncbi:hypothetical protein FJZ31_26865 [Candidatus Poribacteria bacterium]|nr:hypothetical protein [Candidatus Poribacteria bacterium]
MLTRGNLTKRAFWGALGLFISLMLTSAFGVTFASEGCSSSTGVAHVKSDSPLTPTTQNIKAILPTEAAHVESESAQITKVIRIKHREANEMKNLLLLENQIGASTGAVVWAPAPGGGELVSAPMPKMAKLVPEGVQLFADDKRNSLIIRGTPDDVKEVEELIKQLDTPLKQMEFRIILIVASPEGTEMPPGEIWHKIFKLFKFTRYEILADVVLQGEEGEKVSAGAEMGEKRYMASFQPSFIDEGSGIIKLRSFSLDKAGPETGFEFVGQSQLLSTTLNVKNDNTVIVGGSTIDGGGKALIVAVTAKTVE